VSGALYPGFSFVCRKLCQDCFTINKLKGKNYEYFFFGVFDGHGLNGEKIAKFVSTKLPKALQMCLQKQNKPEKAFPKAFSMVSKELKASELKAFACGATASCALMNHQRIVLAHLGDSLVTISSRARDGSGNVVYMLSK